MKKKKGQFSHCLVQQHSVLQAAVRHEGNGLRDLPCCAVDVRTRRIRVLVARGAEESDDKKKNVSRECLYFLLMYLAESKEKNKVLYT